MEVGLDAIGHGLIKYDPEAGWRVSDSGKLTSVKPGSNPQDSNSDPHRPRWCEGLSGDKMLLQP